MFPPQLELRTVPGSPSVGVHLQLWCS